MDCRLLMMSSEPNGLKFSAVTRAQESSDAFSEHHNWRGSDFLVSRPIFMVRALIFWNWPAVTHRVVVEGPVNHPVLCGARRGATADWNRLAHKVAPHRVDLCTRAAY